MRRQPQRRSCRRISLRCPRRHSRRRQAQAPPTLLLVVATYERLLAEKEGRLMDLRDALESEREHKPTARAGSLSRTRTAAGFCAKHGSAQGILGLVDGRLVGRPFRDERSVHGLPSPICVYTSRFRLCLGAATIRSALRFRHLLVNILISTFCFNRESIRSHCREMERALRATPPQGADRFQHQAQHFRPPVNGQHLGRARRLEPRNVGLVVLMKSLIECICLVSNSSSLMGSNLAYNFHLII